MSFPKPTEVLAPGGCDRCSKPATSVEFCAACGKAYARCAAHGGAEGARRSLKSHKGLYHPGAGAGS